MRLYSGSSSHFIEDTTRNQIAEKLKTAFFHHFRFNPSPGEYKSWQNSLRAVSSVFHSADLTDHGVILEYQLPLTSRRLDCLICGRDSENRDRAVIIELKQWDKCDPSDGENLVATWVGGNMRDVLHPSAQVGQYQRYLQDTHTAFYEDDTPVGLNSCSYLHNYYPEPDDTLFSESYAALVANYPVYTADAVPEFRDYLANRLSDGKGMQVLQRIEESRYRPSKKLMNHVSGMIKGKEEFILLDEQLVVYDRVLASARRGFHDRKKTVVLIKGGPGTGKSVIAINLMGDLLKEDLNTHYATGSRAFTETLRKIIGRRGGIQFNYFNSYMDADYDDIDVLICDEAHRIRETSNHRFMKKADRSNKLQVQELIDASKVSVFFIDDDQLVRPDEIGSAQLILDTAKRNDCRMYEYELEAQFRCAGSEGFVNWISNTLGIQRTANVIWDGAEEFDFRIFQSPQELESAIRDKVDEGHTGRVTAGFCWPWSKKLEDGELASDVQIESYHRPWNARPEATRLPKHIPKSNLWAYDPNGIEQIGCIYTAQGFEFDYVGVIFGKDLIYDFDQDGWAGNPKNSHDHSVKRSKGKFIDLVKNTYRVLLSRGLKGCYVYFMDKDSERFFRSRMESGESAPEEKRVASTPRPKTPPAQQFPPELTILSGDEAKPFQNCVPLYDLKVAAGRFSEEQIVEESPQTPELLDPDEYTWIELPDVFRPQQGLFVSQVIGESMNRRIPNGSYCLFRLIPAGTRNGKIVLAQHREIQDSETGGHFTVKIYESEKRETEDDGWEHTRITLKPDSTDSGFSSIVISEEQAGDVQILAEMVAILA